MLIVGDKHIVFNGINLISYEELPKTEPFSVEKTPYFD